MGLLRDIFKRKSNINDAQSHDAELKRGRETERERQRQEELEREREDERERQLVAELVREREAERERQRVAELAREREAERERLRQAELEREREAEQERQRQEELERERDVEQERQRQAELEREREEEQKRQLQERCEPEQLSVQLEHYDSSECQSAAAALSFVNPNQDEINNKFELNWQYNLQHYAISKRLEDLKNRIRSEQDRKGRRKEKDNKVFCRFLTNEYCVKYDFFPAHCDGRDFAPISPCTWKERHLDNVKIKTFSESCKENAFIDEFPVDISKTAEGFYGRTITKISTEEIIGLCQLVENIHDNPDK